MQVPNYTRRGKEYWVMNKTKKHATFFMSHSKNMIGNLQFCIKLGKPDFSILQHYPSETSIKSG